MKTLKIGLPCSPATIIESEEIDVSEVLISYGGGMGGANKRYYCTNIEEYIMGVHKGMLALTLITGEKTSINPSFVVEIKDRTVVKVVTDKTRHKNYHSEKEIKKSILTEYILLNYNESYEIITDVRDMNFDREKIIFAEYDDEN